MPHPLVVTSTNNSFYWDKMTTHIKILQPIVEKQNPKNKYRLTITFMHGDADAETIETYGFFPNDPNLIPMVELFTGLPSYLELYTSSEWRMYLQGQGYDAGFIDRVLDMLIYDITNDGNSLAVPHSTRLTYFNEDGVEHTTRIVSDPRRRLTQQSVP